MGIIYNVPQEIPIVIREIAIFLGWKGFFLQKWKFCIKHPGPLLLQNRISDFSLTARCSPTQRAEGIRGSQSCEGQPPFPFTQSPATLLIANRIATFFAESLFPRILLKTPRLCW